MHKASNNLDINFACLSLSLYPINEPIGPKLIVGPHMTLGRVMYV